MKLKALAILGLILLSLFPVYLLYTWMQRVMRPRESMRRFILWVLASLLLILASTFIVVLLIRLIFPGA